MFFFLSDIKDRCVLKLVELAPNAMNTSQISLSSTTTIQNKKFPSTQSSSTYQTNSYGFESNTNLANTNTLIHPNQFTYYPAAQAVPQVSQESETINDLEQKTNSNPRSLSEPRHSKNQTKQSNFTYSTTNPQEYYLTNQDLISNSNQAETYDNLNENQTSHQSRIAKVNYNYFDRYNRTLRPIYNSMRVPDRDIKSVDRDIGYFNQTPRKMNTSSEGYFRDIKSCDRDLMANNTEDDQSSIQSTLSVKQDGLTNKQSAGETSNDIESYDEEDDDERTVNDNNENLLNSLDENDIENFDNSKIKMKLMQKQLETLTNLVHQALVSKDLNRLEMAAPKFISKMNVSKKKQSELNVLNEKTKALKKDLNSIKKMQENFNSTFGDSMKGFIKQINVFLFRDYLFNFRIFG